MALVLQHRGDARIPIRLDRVDPWTLRGKTAAQIERVAVRHGNTRLALAEVFRLAGEVDDGKMVLDGDFSSVDGVGGGMKGGDIRVTGSVGDDAGAEMAGGRLTIDGRAGHGVGIQMRAGLIHVHGDAGNDAGGAYPGAPRGMVGGTILVEGGAGEQAGRAMRRGLVALGACGDAVGANMLAGTLLVFGASGRSPGANMHRGTIGLFGSDRTALLPTFRYACRLRPGFLAMLLRDLQRLGYGPATAASRRGSETWPAEVRLFHGDLVSGGRGEVLLLP